jgi:hypothetical protein
MAKPTAIVKTARRIESSHERGGTIFSRTGDDHETPNHDHWTSGVLREAFRDFKRLEACGKTYQTVEEQRRYTSHDADDGERDSEVLKNRS